MNKLQYLIIIDHHHQPPISEGHGIAWQTLARPNTSSLIVSRYSCLQRVGTIMSLMVASRILSGNLWIACLPLLTFSPIMGLLHVAMDRRLSSCDTHLAFLPSLHSYCIPSCHLLCFLAIQLSSYVMWSSFVLPLAHRFPSTSFCNTFLDRTLCIGTSSNYVCALSFTIANSN